MAYGILKCDTVTFTDAGVDKSVTLSGLVQNPTFSGNVTVTGTLSGVTVTGTTANFTSGNFTNISGDTHTITSGVFAAGSAASPSITFTGDLNTGIYSPGADQVAISTNGTKRIEIQADGDIDIDNGGVFYDATNNRLAIGATPLAKFHVNLGTNENIHFATGGSGDQRIQALNDAGGTSVQLSIQASPLLFRGAGGSEVGRWDTSGRLLVGTSSDSGGALLQVNGDRIRVGTAKTPASATATGTAGEICWDASYVYVCTATNTWKRSALSTW
jgi:hypothetical protein